MIAEAAHGVACATLSGITSCNSAVRVFGSLRGAQMREFRNLALHCDPTIPGRRRAAIENHRGTDVDRAPNLRLALQIPLPFDAHINGVADQHGQ